MSTHTHKAHPLSTPGHLQMHLDTRSGHTQLPVLVFAGNKMTLSLLLISTLKKGSAPSSESFPLGKQTRILDQVGPVYPRCLREERDGWGPSARRGLQLKQVGTRWW